MINEEVRLKILQNQAKGFDRGYIQRLLIENGVHPTDIYDTFNNIEEQEEAHIEPPLVQTSVWKIVLIAGLMFVVFLGLIIGIIAIFL